jgi:hypothetical protein
VSPTSFMLLAKRDTEEKREAPSIVLIESLQHLVTLKSTSKGASKAAVAKQLAGQLTSELVTKLVKRKAASQAGSVRFLL